MIGIFDSGVGGLTALRELRRLRPDLDVIYYADTAHLPYGTRSHGDVTRLVRRALARLTALGAEGVLVACGTASSVALPHLGGEVKVPLWGVVAPAAEAAWRHSKSKRIGILATEATIRTRAFEKAVAACGSALTVARACPLLVSLAEYGFTAPTDPVAQAAVAHYLAPLARAKVDSIILGCTHFPLLAGAISRYLPHARLIGAGEESAAALCATHPRVGHGALAVYVSGDPNSFGAQAARILGAPLPCPVLQLAGEKDL